MWDRSLIHTRDLLTIYVTLDTYFYVSNRIRDEIIRPSPIFLSRSQSRRDFERKFYTSDYSSVLFSNAASNTTFTRTRAASFLFADPILVLFAAALLRIVPLFSITRTRSISSVPRWGEGTKIGSRERE